MEEEFLCNKIEIATEHSQVHTIFTILRASSDSASLLTTLQPLQIFHIHTFNCCLLEEMPMVTGVGFPLSVDGNPLAFCVLRQATLMCDLLLLFFL
jgi:hypothetical protein